MLFVLMVVFGLGVTGTALADHRSYHPLVPCGGTGQESCTQCDFLKLGKNLIDFTLFFIIPIVGTIFIVISGFMILLGGAYPATIDRGKKIFWNVIIGIVIISTSWLMVNFLLKSLAGDSDISENWYKLSCKTQAKTIEGVPGAEAPSGGDLCSNPQALAAQNNVPYPRTNAPELDRLMTCIGSELRGLNVGEVSTFDKTWELCNYSRGKRICTTGCYHAVNSCHYGGSSGDRGALAVDYGNEDNGDKIISAALKCGAKSARCENPVGMTVSCSNSEASHVHVNSRSCDRN